MYKAIIYDIDGTILNTLDMNMIPLQKLIKEELRIDISYEDVLKYASYPGMKVMSELGFEDIEKSYNKWVSYINEYEEGAVIYPGIIDMLDYFSENTVQAIVSSKKRKQYKIDIIDKDLDHYFQVVVLEDDTEKHKPNPEPLQKCIEKLELYPHEVIYIGDAMSDVMCCLNANVDFGFARWGSVADLNIDNCKFVFDEPADLIRTLSSLLVDDSNGS